VKGRRNVTTNSSVAGLFVPMMRFTVSGCLDAGPNFLMPIASQSVVVLLHTSPFVTTTTLVLVRNLESGLVRLLGRAAGG